jgi:hypothetical protein
MTFMRLVSPADVSHQMAGSLFFRAIPLRAKKQSPKGQKSGTNHRHVGETSAPSAQESVAAARHLPPARRRKPVDAGSESNSSSQAGAIRRRKRCSGRRGWAMRTRFSPRMNVDVAGRRRPQSRCACSEGDITNGPMPALGQRLWGSPELERGTPVNMENGLHCHNGEGMAAWAFPLPTRRGVGTN